MSALLEDKSRRGYGLLVSVILNLILIFRFVFLFSIIFINIFFSHSVLAVDFGYFLYQDGSYSNNINQLPRGEEVSGKKYTSGVGADIGITDSSDLYADMRTYYYITRYTGDEIEAEENKFLNANLIYSPASSHASIALMDELTQVPADRFSVDDTKNLDIFNIAAVRPAYYLSFGQLDKLGFEYLYLNLNDINGSNIGGDTSRVNNKFSIDYLKKLNKSSNFSLVISQGETIFDVEGGVDYKQRDAFVRWYRSKRNTSFGLSLGRSRVQTEEDNIFDENYFEFSLIRQINSRHSMNVLATSGFNNVVDPIFGEKIAPINVGQQTVFFSQSVAQDQLRFSYYISDRIYSNRLSYQYTALDNPDFEAKEIQQRIDYLFSYPISRFLDFDKKISFVFRLEATSVAVDDIDEKTIIGRGEMGFEYSPRPNFLLSAAFKSRQTKNLNDDSDSRELSFALGVTFSPDNLFQGI